MNMEEDRDEYYKELDAKAFYYSLNKEHLKKSPSLAIIDLVHKEMQERQNNGYVPKSGFCLQEKNRVALKFLDLHDRVVKHQKQAM